MAKDPGIQESSEECWDGLIANENVVEKCHVHVKNINKNLISFIIP